MCELENVRSHDGQPVRTTPASGRDGAVEGSPVREGLDGGLLDSDEFREPRDNPRPRTMKTTLRTTFENVLHQHAARMMGEADHDDPADRDGTPQGRGLLVTCEQREAIGRMIAQLDVTLAEPKKRYGPAPAVEGLRASHAGKRPIHANGATAAFRESHGKD